VITRLIISLDFKLDEHGVCPENADQMGIIYMR
jgi:hypothetical protein